MSCERTVIVLVETETCEGCGRTAVEHTQKQEFKDAEEVRSYLETEEGINPQSVSILELDEFMDDWNDTDSDNTVLNMSTFMGYVIIRN